MSLQRETATSEPTGYAPGYTKTRISFMEKRRGSTHAAFAYPFLTPASRVLDCGCGPGTITNDIATQVPDGFILGIDINDSQVHRARELARANGLINAFYQQQDISALELSDNAFDVVFSEALIDHVQDQLGAIREMKRVLRAGGTIALRSPEWDRLTFEPSTPDGPYFINAYLQRITQGGGDPYTSQKIADYLEQLGFTNIKVSFGTEQHQPTLSFVQAISEPSLRVPDAFTPNVRNEMTMRYEQLAQWAANPQSIIHEVWFECTATKGPAAPPD